jgi:hypothetical protein
MLELHGENLPMISDIKRFAYADPPYFTMGKKMYGSLHPDAEMWDQKESHINLIDRLLHEYPDGWALSCNPKDLWWILAERENIRVCAWTKTFHQIRGTTNQYAWEAVLLYGGRKDNKRKPMVRDWLSCPIAMRKGLQGAKPSAFNHWILDLLNYQKGDLVDDLFPGSHGMAEAIEQRNQMFSFQDEGSI